MQRQLPAELVSKKCPVVAEGDTANECDASNLG
jgi:hypothetical protein